MSASDVLDRFGTAALLRCLGLVSLFVVLHLVRLTLMGAAWLLNAGMRGIDARLIAGATGTRFDPAGAGV